MKDAVAAGRRRAKADGWSAIAKKTDKTGKEREVRDVGCDAALACGGE